MARAEAAGRAERQPHSREVRVAADVAVVSLDRRVRSRDMGRVVEKPRLSLSKAVARHRRFPGGPFLGVVFE